MMKITLEYDGAKDVMRLTNGDSYVSEHADTFRGLLSGEPQAYERFSRCLRAIVLIMADGNGK